MLRRVQKYINDNKLLTPESRVLVCLSGGADSVALLDVLLRSGYECIVVHCNFHLRGAESNRDEQFVRRIVVELADRLPHKKDWLKDGITLEVKDFDTTAYAKANSISIEMAARDLRYAWFAEMARKYNCDCIAVAHHQNDQAETVLMNLKRGTGLRGLQGMRPISVMETAGGQVRIIRPLLCTTHDYICHYLKDIRKIDWVEDSTNKDTKIKRNGIRAELSNYTKAEIEHIAQTARIIQGYVDILEEKNSPQALETIEYETLRNNR